ncbi:MAG: flagellar hook assembly protein FlgD [Hyphomicrobiaceae bacterium]
MDVAPTATSRATSAETASGTTSATGAGTSLDYNAFLKLLIAQMQNQDPLEPMKSSDYVAQLATFSQVEKSVEMNTRLSDVLSAVQMQQAGDLLGKTLTSADGQTTGTVAAAKLVNGGVVAVLADGREIAMSPGVVVGGSSI